jgi:hypothetical protein
LTVILQGLALSNMLNETDDNRASLSTEIDLESVLPMLDEIAELPQNMDSEAEDKVEEIKKQIGQGLGSDQVKKLAKQIDNFEFEGAQDTLAHFKSTLEKSS